MEEQAHDVPTLLGTVLLTLAVLLGTAGALAVTFRDTVVDAEEFAERAADALATPGAREVVAEAVADVVVAQVPDALSVRPVVELAVEAAVASPVFRDILVAALADVHRTVLAGGEDTVTLRLVDFLTVVRTQLAFVAPDLAERVPTELTDAFLEVSQDQLTLEAVRVLDSVRVAAFVCPVAALLAMVLFVARSADSRAALLPAGVAVLGVAVAVLVVERLGHVVLLSQVRPQRLRVVSEALWDAVARDVLAMSGGLAAVGAAVAASAFLTREGVHLAEVAPRLLPLLSRPRGRWRGAGWSLGVATLGLLLVLRGPDVLRLGLVVTGTVLVLVALNEAGRLLPSRRTRTVRPAGGAARRWHVVPAALLAPAAAVVLLALAGAVLLLLIDRSGGPASALGGYDPRCNGSVLLCDRRLDQVVVPATHNSMSSATDGFLRANHAEGIVRQLDAGYRGLLLDVYPGLRSPDRPVVTDRAPVSGQERDDLVRQVGEEAVRAAERQRERTLAAGGTRELFLCHAFCEIGATPLVPELGRVRDWLERHPREVLVVFVQDEAPAQDVVRAFEESGLSDLAVSVRPGKPLPTIAELLDSGQRLLVLAENEGGTVAQAPWYHDGFALAQETPYAFGSVEELSCATNRGRKDAPLFLVNHFLSPPAPAQARTVNSAEVLRARLQRCQQERGLLPNLVAVDFFEQGDVLQVVREINERGTAS